jgi:hypothetical protein
VLILGPLAEFVVDKLVQDFPDKFTRCMPELMYCSQAMLEKGIDENIFIDYRRKGSQFECTTVASVKEICDKVRFLTFSIDQKIINFLYLELALHFGCFAQRHLETATTADLSDCSVGQI